MSGAPVGDERCAALRAEVHRLSPELVGREYTRRLRHVLDTGSNGRGYIGVVPEWILEDGRDLPTVAGVPDRGTFDWSELHTVLAALPAGRWTTYGDLAEVIGTAAQPLGQHLTSCTSCLNAHRVLGADGRPRTAFRWSGPSDQRSQQQALEAVGVSFTDGVAVLSVRLGSAELEQLVTPPTA